MREDFFHISVMFNEAMSFFTDMQGKTIVDVTAGKGGHFAGLIEKVGANGKVIAFDKDLRAHEQDAAFGVMQKYPNNSELYHLSFSQLASFLQHKNIKIDGIMCDLGVSSNQLDDPKRGFSLKNDGPIDMRMDQTSGISAYDWLLKNDEKTIADTLFQFGDEKKSRQIASLIKKSWPIKNSTLELANIITKAIRPQKFTKTHPATRSFQALRIAVNNELQELISLLQSLPEVLNKNAVAVFISFHSIEDRIIKQSFKELSKVGFKILTKKPLIASKEEILVNKRSRSAKLRAIMRAD